MGFMIVTIKNVFETRVKCRNEGQCAWNPSFLAVGYMVGKLFEVKLHWMLYYMLA